MPVTSAFLIVCIMAYQPARWPHDRNENLTGSVGRGGFFGAHTVVAAAAAQSAMMRMCAESADVCRSRGLTPCGSVGMSAGSTGT